ncbi:hypothetical protein BDW68DRAFT_175759 [Aspergillus falconensis]
MADGTLRPSLTCHICLETFRTAKHLKRHAPTHDDAKPHVCHFCGAQYERRCVLRLPLTGSLPHGETLVKLAAGAGMPGLKSQSAAYPPSAHIIVSGRAPACANRLTLPNKRHPRAPQRELQLKVSWGAFRLRRIVWDAKDRSTSTHGPLFRFLARFTKANGLNEAYSYKVQSTTVNPSSSQLKEDGGADWDGLLGTTVSNPFDCYLDEFESCLWSYTDTARGHIGEALLAKKACQSWDSLQCILDGLTEQPPRTFPSSEWFAFFSPANATRYLHLFWTRWYHHCPIVHKATFGLNTCSHLLLITMCLIGACMSARETDHQSANRFLDVIEIIFSNPLFLESPRKAPTNDTLLETQENIQILQATCFMCLLQKWEGSVQGFTAFVATTGAMGLS